ncbi:MAG: hypothetical protein AAF514_11085 [Verrucomicrobiota bacterium]
MPGRKRNLSRDDILLGLERINSFLKARGTRGEIGIYGGACMCLAFSARNSTKDIDAVFEPAQAVRKAAFETAAELGWDWNWLNDDVKSFLSKEATEPKVDTLEWPEFSHLKVFTARADYLLAMKILASRANGEEDPSPDLSDAVFLCRQLGIRKKETILEIVTRYYPDKDLPERADFFIHEILKQRSNHA